MNVLAINGSPLRERSNTCRLLEPLLEGAEREMARQGRVPDELPAPLRRPVIEWAGVTAEQYVSAGNEAFERALRAARRRRHDG